jgi:hypothetical protein
MDVLAVTIPFGRKMTLLLEVVFQLRNMISVIVPQPDRASFEQLTIGSPINGVRFHTPSVIFEDVGVVGAIEQIQTGYAKEGVTLLLEVPNL